MVAKHPHAQEQLKGQLHTPAFRRIYLAVCEGIPRPPEGRIDAPIGRVPGALMARQVDPAGQPASTRYRVLRTGQGRALVELEVKPGGGVRVELMDKGAALGAILKAGLPQDGDPEAVASFFAALQGAAREEPASGDDGKN